MSYRTMKQQYRGAERVVAKFVVSGAGATLTKVGGNGNVTTVNGESGNRDVASPVTVTASVFTLNLPKSRLLTLVSATYNSGVATNTLQGLVNPVTDGNAKAGTQQFVVTRQTDGTLLTMANGAVLTFAWEMAR